MHYNKTLFIFLQVEHETGKQYTYRELFQNVENIRSALYELGMRKGDALVHSYNTSFESPAVLFAVWSLGATNIGIYDDCKVGESTILLCLL